MIVGGVSQLLRLALRNLYGHPLRTFLTTLGIMFGAGSVIAMMAVGKGAEEALLRDIGRLGIENIILNTVKPPEKQEDTQTNSWQFNRYGLTFKDEEQIRETVPGLKKVLPVHKRPPTIWWGSRKIEAAMYAVKPEHMELFGLNVIRGRNLTDLDDERLNRVCVIRSGLLQRLGIFDEPIGLPIQAEGSYYRIVGVLPDEGLLGYASKALDIDARTTQIYVPYGTVFRRLGTKTTIQRQGSRERTDIELNQIVVSVEDVDDVLITAQMLSRILEKNHEDKDYEMVVPLEVLEQRRKTQFVFNIAMIFIASISLFVGGIGIANIMLATVTERTREIGIRRALGAKQRDIMAQFLAETAGISTLGGVLGVAIGFGFIQLVTVLTGWEAIVTLPIVLLAVGISMLVGIFFGIFPARRAAMLDPIAALRHE